MRLKNLCLLMMECNDTYQYMICNCGSHCFWQEFVYYDWIYYNVLLNIIWWMSSSQHFMLSKLSTYVLQSWSRYFSIKFKKKTMKQAKCQPGLCNLSFCHNLVYQVFIKSIFIFYIKFVFLCQSICVSHHATIEQYFWTDIV